MTDEKKTIRPCEFFSICEAACGGTLEDIEICSCYEIFKQLKHKEQECEELHSRTASIIYNLTGGRLSYSTYTLEGCGDAYRDQLSIDVERATKELEKENETLKQQVEELQEWKDANKPTGICETCTAKSLQEADICRNALSI